jgi:hypothetical protein
LSDRNALRPSALDLDNPMLRFRPDDYGTPDPNVTAGWQQIYSNLTSPTDWNGVARNYADALLMGSTAPEGRVLFHGTSGELTGGMRPSSRGYFGPGVYLSKQPSTAQTYGQNVYKFGVPDEIFQASHPKGTLQSDPAAEGSILGALTEAERQKVSDLKSWYGNDSAAFYQALSRTLPPDRVQAAFKAAGYQGIEGMGDGHEVVVFDPAAVTPLGKHEATP